MESYLSKRGGGGESDRRHYEETAEFLRQLQSARESGVIVIAMTNMIDAIDPAIKRRGRFDFHIEVGLPVEQEICEVLKSVTKNICVEKGLDYPTIAKRLVGYTLADVTFAMRDAGIISGKEGLDYVSIASINEAVAKIRVEKKKSVMGEMKKDLKKPEVITPEIVTPAKSPATKSGSPYPTDKPFDYNEFEDSLGLSHKFTEAAADGNTIKLLKGINAYLDDIAKKNEKGEKQF
jgi:hypothetical protein